MKNIDEIINFIGDFTLSFQEKDIYLIGCLVRRGKNIVLECRGHKDNLELFHCKEQLQIYGSVAGIDVTLLDSHVSSVKYINISNEYGMLTIIPSEIVIGRSTKNAIKVNTISSAMKDLNKMLIGEVFEENFHMTKDNPSVMNYTFPEELFAVDAEGKLSVGRTFGVSNGRDGVDISIVPYVSFTFNTSVEIHEAIAKIASFRNLCAFFADYYLPLGDFSFADDETPKGYSEDYCDCTLILNHAENIKAPDNPFLVSSVAFESSFQEIWDNWQSFNKNNKHITALFFEMISNHSRRTNRFLNLCQCLEVYSNHFRNSEAEIVRDKYSTGKKGTVTLRHRLEDLFLHMNQYLMLQEATCVNLAETISKARNYFTHYNEKRYSEPSFDCIANSCEFLHFVLLVIVYKTVGVPDKHILECKRQRAYTNMDVFISKIT